MSNILDLTQVCEICLCEIKGKNASHANLCECCSNELDAIENLRRIMSYTRSPKHLFSCPICGNDLIHLGMVQDAHCPHCHLWFTQGNINERDHTHDFVAIHYSDGRELRYDAGSHIPLFDKVKTIAEVCYENWQLRKFYTFEQYLAGAYLNNTSTIQSNILDRRSENQKRLDKLGI